MNRPITVILLLCFLNTFSYSQSKNGLDENIGQVVSRELNTFYELINLSLGSSASPEYHNRIISVAKDMTFKEDSKSVFQFSLNKKLAPTPYSIDSLANVKNKLALRELRFEIDVFHESMSLGYFIESSKAYPYVRLIIIEKSIAYTNENNYLTTTNQKTAILRIYKDTDSWRINIVSIRNSFSNEKIRGNPTEVIKKSRKLIAENKTIREFQLSDFDLDGILNKDDKCPNTIGELEFSGCPEPTGNSIARLFIPGMNSLLIKENPTQANYFLPIMTYSALGTGAYHLIAKNDSNSATPFFVLGTILLFIDYIEAIHIYRKRNKTRNLLKMNDTNLGFIDQINLGISSYGLGISIRF